MVSLSGNLVFLMKVDHGKILIGSWLIGDIVMSAGLGMRLKQEFRESNGKWQILYKTVQKSFYGVSHK